MAEVARRRRGRRRERAGRAASAAASLAGCRPRLAPALAAAGRGSRLALVAVALVGYEIGNGGRAAAATARRSTGQRRRDHRRSGPAKATAAKLHLADVAASCRRTRCSRPGCEREGEVEPVQALFVPDREGNADDDDRRHERGRRGDGHQGAERRQRGADLGADRPISADLAARGNCRPIGRSGRWRAPAARGSPPAAAAPGRRGPRRSRRRCG